jgi:hypothetical protein
MVLQLVRGCDPYGRKLGEAHKEVLLRVRSEDGGIDYMSQTIGKRVICDRCKAEVFCEYIGEGETDGGYTRWKKFAPLPDGWGFVELHELCPVCMKEWNAICDGFYRKEAEKEDERKPV